MLQFKDDDGYVVANAGYIIGQPITIATATASNAFIQKTVVILTARTAECFFRISKAGTAATTSDHPLAVGASRQVAVDAGDRIANNGGSLVVSIMGTSGTDVVSNYYV